MFSLRPFAVLLFLHTLCRYCVTKHYTIAPNSSLCGTTPCFTLDQLVVQAANLLSNGGNLTLTIQPGVHTLTQPLSISNFTHVQITGNSSEIFVQSESWFALRDIDQLSIEGLIFIGSYQYLPLHPTQFLNISQVRQCSLNNCHFTSLITSAQLPNDEYGTIVNLKEIAETVIENVAFRDNNGTALMINYGGNVSIQNCTFTGNQGDYGAAFFMDSTTITVTINNSTFSNNNATFGGAISVLSGELLISDSVLTGNTAQIGGGILVYSGNVFLQNNTVIGNSALLNGGGIMTHIGSISVSNSIFIENNAENEGGGVFLDSGNASVSHSLFMSNSAGKSGGGMFLVSSSVSINETDLRSNSAKVYGGGIYLDTSNASISGSVFTRNSATNGGSICAVSVGLLIANSDLTNNFANIGGGVLVLLGSISILYSEFVDNMVGLYGGAIAVLSTNNAFASHNNWTGNSAVLFGGAIFIGSETASIFDNVFSRNHAGNNGGGIVVLKGGASISQCELTNNTAGNSGGGISFSGFAGSLTICNTTLTGNSAGHSGGAIQAFGGTVHFITAGVHQEKLGRYLETLLKIINNTAAEVGGGIFLRQSNLIIDCTASLSDNRAVDGGAIFAYDSTIDFNSTDGQNIIKNNVADNGGGIYAIASIIQVKSSVRLDSNRAEQNGGGFYLQQNSRMYLRTLESQRVNLTISNNMAQLGGGVYIDDSTAGVCGVGTDSTISNSIIGECFIQTVKLFYESVRENTDNVKTYITNNTAHKSGSAIYGGLLDRCTVPQTSELLTTNYSDGLDYVKRTVALPTYNDSISSDPLQVKLCGGSLWLNMYRKGQPFRLRVKAIDQVGNSVNATIHSSVVTKSGIGRLKEGQVEQYVGSECTEVEYNVFSKDSFAQVELYAIGPCSNLGISKLTFTVTFLNCTCSLGFHPSSSQIECKCDCDQELQVTECFNEEETFQLHPDKWIGISNSTECNETGYLLHDCPFDYCVDQPVNISLNSSQQIDRQCAYNRSGVLCGECEEGLSLVFASSKCKECSNIYLLLLIPFSMAGIALVAYILLLNITVATGTIHGLMFYTNVIAANNAIFLPFKAPNFLTVFISWVNLDLGIETCFYSGMSSQAKVLLQVAFPAYIFLLIILVIVLSGYINSVAKLLSNRNPVAALCTLITLSYSKLIRIIIATLQYTSLDCPDGSQYKVWLYDANAQYLSRSHIPRFVAAAIILTGCILFTTLLFFGQWFPRCSKWKVMKWTKNTKYIGFMDAFHAPFTPKHRYWPGLLLFALIVNNIAASLASDTVTPVLSSGCLALGLIVYKSLANRVYKDKLNSALETLFLMNICVLSYGTFTVRNTAEQCTLANVSLAIVFVMFVVITCYHVYKYVLRKTDVWINHVRPLKPDFNFRKNRPFYQKLADREENVDIEIQEIPEVYKYGSEQGEDTDPDKYITPPIIRPATRPDQLREPDLDILAPVTEDDYRQALPMPPTEIKPVCTSTIVEITRD